MSNNPSKKLGSAGSDGVTPADARIGPAPRRRDFPPQQGEASALADKYKTQVQTIAKARLYILIFIAVLALLSTELVAWKTGCLIISIVLFAGLAIGEITVWFSKPDKHWQDARSLSELIKSLTWRYVVGADGTFLEHGSTDDIEARFIARIREVTVPYKKTLTLESQKESSEHMSTRWMETTRESSLEVRKAIYKTYRFKHQLDWYEENIDKNNKASRFWWVVMCALYLIGVACACFEMLSIIQFDILGAIGAVATSALAWVQSQQHQSLAHEYSVTRDNLRYLEHRFKKVTENDWPNLVDDVEREFAREHAAWQAERRAYHREMKPE